MGFLGRVNQICKGLEAKKVHNEFKELQKVCGLVQREHDNKGAWRVRSERRRLVGCLRCFHYPNDTGNTARFQWQH
jgi:hypothetical protein